MKKFILSIFGVLVILGLFGAYVLHEIGSTDITDHFSSALSVEEARQLKCPIPLPDNAKNVRFGIAGAFGSYEYLVKFEAPVDVCRAHVLTVFSATSGPKPTLTALTEHPMPLSAPRTMFGKAPWFDIENISHGESAYWGDSIWIDDDRGIFYYQRMQ
jgi:hypothetical protein